MHQLDYRYRPCNFVEILPRLDEHLRRPKAKARRHEAVRLADGRDAGSLQLQIPDTRRPRPGPSYCCVSLRGQREAGLLIDAARGGKDAVRPQRDRLVAGLTREADAFVDEPRAEAEAARLRIDQQQPQARDARSCPSPA